MELLHETPVGSAGGLTERDISLARRVERLVASTKAPARPGG
jgi:pterin-4a-carbinolamine dehydratase